MGIHCTGCASLDIPKNWNESWDVFRATLQVLQERGLDPRHAILALRDSDVRVDAKSSVDINISSVAHLRPRLGTNHIPTQLEREKLKRFAATAAKEISRAFTRVQEIRRHLAEAEASYSAATALLEPYLALLSPIRTLPPEILQEIFIAGMPTRHDVIMHPSQIPLILGQVCAAWRALSRATPVLWASVHVALCVGETSSALAARCDLLRRWLARSGDVVPLQISLFVPVGLPLNVTVKSLVDIIVPYSRRWRSLTLVPATRSELDPVWKLDREDVPMLESIEVADHAYQSREPPAWRRFIELPRTLRRVALNYFNAATPLPNCAWSCITSLSLGSQQEFFGLTEPQLLQLLLQCQSLEDCRLTLPISPTIPWTPTAGPPLAAAAASPPQTLTLSRLKTFTIAADVLPDATFNLARILDALVLPALQLLEVAAILYHIYEFSPVAAISDPILATDNLLFRSSCDLRALSVHFGAGDANILLQSLRRVPNLRTLRLNHTFTAQNQLDLMPVLRELTLSSDAGLCPNITHLRLIRCDQTPDFHPVLQSLLESRSARLRVVELVLMFRSSALAALNTGKLCKATISMPPPGESRLEQAQAGILDADREL